MGGFGERMQREREMRGITLEEIAESTKIGTRSLRALEEEDFAKLPGGIFNKGFVRAYARYLGIDEEQAVADFVAAAQAEAAKPATEAPERPILVDEPEPERNWSGVALLVMLAALVVAGWRLYPTLERLGARAWSGAARSAAPAPAAARSATNPATTVAPSAPPAPVTPASSTPQNAAALSSQAGAGAPPPPAAAATGGFVVEIRASKVSWVSITADGKLFSQGMLGAQQVKLVRAQNRVVLKMGNAGGIEVSHNGKPLPALGGDGQTATVVFTPEGVQR